MDATAEDPEESRLLRALLSEDEPPGLRCTFVDLLDELGYWLEHPSAIVEHRHNLRFLREDLSASFDVFGRTATAALEGAVRPLLTSLEEFSRHSDGGGGARPAAVLVPTIQQQQEAVCSAIEGGAVRVAVWNDLLADVERATSDGYWHQRDILRRLVARGGHDQHWLYWLASPIRIDASGVRSDASWSEIKSNGRIQLAESASHVRRIVYTTVTKAALEGHKKYMGPLSFYRADWLSQVLAQHDHPDWDELPPELTTDDSVRQIRLAFVPEDPPPDMLVTRIDLGTGAPADLKNQARELLETVISFASLRVRWGTWMLGSDFEYVSNGTSGAGTWDDRVGPSTLAPGYVAEELAGLEERGEFAFLLEGSPAAHRLRLAGRALAAAEASPDPAQRLTESMRTIEHLLPDTQRRWALMNKDLAPWWTAVDVANWMCSVLDTVATHAVTFHKGSQQEALFRGLVSSDAGTRMRSEIIGRLDEVSIEGLLLHPLTTVYFRQVQAWYHQPQQLRDVVSKGAEEFCLKVGRARRTRNGLMHLGRPPDGVLNSAAHFAFGIARYLATATLWAAPRGESLVQHVRRRHQRAQHFLDAVQRGDLLGAVDTV